MDRSIPLQKNDDITLTIDALGSDAQGIGRVEGYAVFVPGALVGETVRAHIVKTTASYAVARLVQIEAPSPRRVKPSCAAYGKCGGCAMQHMEYAAQLEAKRDFVADALRKLGHLADTEVMPTLGMEEPWRYRNKGSFPYALENGCAAFGFFAPRSHRLVPLADCPIQDTRVVAVAAAVRDWATENGISLYDEASHMGTLRHSMARVAKNGDVMAVVVTHGKLPRRDELTALLRARVPGLKSIVHDRNDARTNVIFGESFTTLWGDESIEDTVCGLRFGVSAASFMQVNAQQTEKLYSAAIEFLAPKSTDAIVDVYCGIGTLSLLASQKAASVLGVESFAQAVEDARVNAQRNGISNVEFVCGEAETVLPSLVEKGLRPDGILLDPPRKGCEQPALQAILDCGAPRLVYVSCNPATLARDCAFLCAGGFKVEKVQPVDMFPQTAHVETIVLMTRLCGSVE